MNIILGFGSTEKGFEENEYNFVQNFLKKKATGNYYSNEVVEELKQELKKRADDYKKLDEEYKTSPTFPDRYGYYYFNVINDASDLCVICTFMHINRRHALSPDGWGMMVSKPVWYFKHGDY